MRRYRWRLGVSDRWRDDEPDDEEREQVEDGHPDEDVFCGSRHIATRVLGLRRGDRSRL